MTPHNTKSCAAHVLLALTAAGLLTLAACGPRSANPSAPTDSNGRQLLDDPHFLAGLEVHDPAPGKHVPCGNLQLPGTSGPPRWWLVQWNSRFGLAGTAPTKLPHGGLQFQNEGKSIRLAPGSAADGDIVLAADTRSEYHDQPYRQGTPWVHLLLEQPLAKRPKLAQLKELRFLAKFRLLHDQPFHPANFDPKLHNDVAQFSAFLIVANRNPASRGYGDFLWFGVPFYDSRYPQSPGHAAADVGTGKYIYTPPGTTFTQRDPRDGNWITIDRDVLPLMLDGLNKAWSQGFLANSRDLSDFEVSAINIGWELPGQHNAAMQLRDLSLVAHENGPPEHAR